MGAKPVFMSLEKAFAMPGRMAPENPKGLTLSEAKKMHQSGGFGANKKIKIFSGQGKTPIRPGGVFAQLQPVKTRAGILFASGRNVFVTGNVRNRVGLRKILAQLSQGLVLRGLEALALQALQLDANGVVVAVAAPPVAGVAGMPGPVVGADTLPEAAVSTDKKVGRYLQTANLLKVRVRLPVQAVGEQLQHFGAAIVTWGQADGVHHDQINAGTCGSWPEVGRTQVLRFGVPALIPKCFMSHAVQPGWWSWAAVRCSVLQ